MIECCKKMRRFEGFSNCQRGNMKSRGVNEIMGSSPPTREEGKVIE